MTRLLAIDPGERVGWAVGEAHPDKLVIVRHGISGLKEFAVKLSNSIGYYETVIYETWKLYPGHAKTMIGNEMQTSQLIGMIRLCAWLNPNVKLVGQGPGIKKTADKTAKAMNPEVADLIEREPGVHDDAHDIDAIRHLWHWYWLNYIKEAS